MPWQLAGLIWRAQVIFSRVFSLIFLFMQQSYFQGTEILNNFFIQIASNSNNKCESPFMRITCLSRSWVTCPFVGANRSHKICLAFTVWNIVENPIYLLSDPFWFSEEEGGNIIGHMFIYVLNWIWGWWKPHANWDLIFKK